MLYHVLLNVPFRPAEQLDGSPVFVFVVVVENEEPVGTKSSTVPRLSRQTKRQANDADADERNNGRQRRNEVPERTRIERHVRVRHLVMSCDMRVCAGQSSSSKNTSKAITMFPLRHSHHHHQRRRSRQSALTTAAQIVVFK